MQVFDKPETMREWSRMQQRTGCRVGLVPTMGYLHDGHRSLVTEAGRNADQIVVSIFVNPVQFGPQEDFAAYPRDEKRDLALCLEAGVAAVLLPQVCDMYAPDTSVSVCEDQLSTGYCGAQRPGHFRGVCTVVTKLFNIVQPQVAVFGQKDFQQAVVIRRMVRDLNIPVEVVTAPIVREPDGLAMSSRNVYLTEGERQRALGLVRALQSADEVLAGGSCDADAIRRRMLEVLRHHQLEPEYAEVADAETLVPVTVAHAGHVALIAVRCGRTRLIDNCIL